MINKKQSKKNKTKLYVLATFIMLGLSSLIFVDLGVMRLIELKKMKRSLNSDIQILLSQQIGLNDEIHKLTYDTLYIEKIAREKFLMVRPGEKVFRVIESKQVQ
jgi:cell division protein FtsB|tara:strand:+ start:210 stop:521 length:312 start_codon:yes stop_codon:yes gene_type:complete